MVDYVNTFTQLGAELKNLKMLIGLWKKAHRVAGDANAMQRLVDAAYDETLNDENAAEKIAKAAAEDIVSQGLRDLFGKMAAEFEQGFGGVLDAELATSEGDKAAGLIRYRYTVLANGQVSIAERQGRFGALRRAMVSDAQTIRKNVVTFGALTPKSGNIGILDTAAFVVAGSDHTWTGTGILTVEDDRVDRLNLRLTIERAAGLDLIRTEKDLLTIKSDNPTRVDKSFEDGETGVNLTIALDDPVTTGDDGVIFPNPAVITFPNENDSDRGKVYLRVTNFQVAQPVYLVEWFNDDAREPGDLVASDTVASGAGVVPVSMEGPGGMRVDIDFDQAAAAIKLPALTNTDDDIIVDIKAPRKGDVWTFTVTNDESGIIATALRELSPISLNSVANPGQTISDALATSVSVTY